MFRLALAAAVAALVLPVTAANAIDCGLAQPACKLVCDVTHRCPR